MARSKNSSSTSKIFSFLYSTIAVFLLVLLISFFIVMVLTIIFHDPVTIQDYFNQISQFVLAIVYGLYGFAIILASFVMQLTNAIGFTKYDVNYWRSDVAYKSLQQFFNYFSCLASGGNSCGS